MTEYQPTWVFYLEPCIPVHGLASESLQAPRNSIQNIECICVFIEKRISIKLMPDCQKIHDTNSGPMNYKLVPLGFLLILVFFCEFLEFTVSVTFFSCKFLFFVFCFWVLLCASMGEHFIYLYNSFKSQNDPFKFSIIVDILQMRSSSFYTTNHNCGYLWGHFFNVCLSHWLRALWKQGIKLLTTV